MNYHHTDVIDTLAAPDASAALLVCNTSDHAPLVTVHRDGRVEIADEYTPDEAAREFWLALGRMNPLQKERDAWRDLALGCVLHLTYKGSYRPTNGCLRCEHLWKAREILCGA